MAPIRITNQMIYERVEGVVELLTGKEKDRHDQGLVGDVQKNTDFRANIQRTFWSLILLILAGNIPIFIFGYKLMFKQ